MAIITINSVILSKKFHIFIFILSVISIFSFHKQFVFRISSVFDTEVHKCPFCFGSSFCNHIEKININFTIIDFLLGILNNKFVFYGEYNKRRIAIKRLASSEELQLFDKQVLQLNNLLQKNEFPTNFETVNFTTKNLLLLNGTSIFSLYKIKLCPSLHNANYFFKPIFNNSSQHDILINTWTSLILNPEPLILQIFKSNHGWPVPEYFGSCGRIEFVEFCGKSLRNYIYHPWFFRVHIFQQLLDMAYNFTFKSDIFAIYLRDISLDNIVLGSDLKIRIVDLEHIILLDKKTPKRNRPITWLSTHVSKHNDCENCLMYSPLEICSHHISDHNFYLFCKEFLNLTDFDDFGFLHSAPNLPYYNSKIDQLLYYINECLNPLNYKSRFEVALDFKELLQEFKMNDNFSIEELMYLI